VKVRSLRVRTLVMLPVLAVAGIGLTACDSKAGSAAVVNGSKISETTVNNYLTANAQAVTSSDGSSTPARQFVLTVITRNAVFKRLLAAAGGAPSDQDLAKAKATALTVSDDELAANVTKSGFSANFTNEYILQVELQQIAGTRFSSAAALSSAITKSNLNVTISPRYGAWDASTLSVVSLGKKQLPNMLTLENPLPGDATASAS
jgi:hypothetical protein